MFARFDENPAMTLPVIKETKSYGRTDGRKHGRTDARTDGQRENCIPPTNKVCGGYKNKVCGGYSKEHKGIICNMTSSSNSSKSTHPTGRVICEELLVLSRFHS